MDDFAVGPVQVHAIEGPGSRVHVVSAEGCVDRYVHGEGPFLQWRLRRAVRWQLRQHYRMANLKRGWNSPDLSIHG